eukprot:490126-Pyramimonas_sp.AAC.2
MQVLLRGGGALLRVASAVVVTLILCTAAVLAQTLGRAPDCVDGQIYSETRQRPRWQWIQKGIADNEKANCALAETETLGSHTGIVYNV